MSNEVALRPIDKLKRMLDSDSVQQQMKNALDKGAPLFMASIIDVFSSNLSDCDPSSVIRESLKAAVLRLPISKGLGFAYLVPYKRSFKDENDQWKSIKEAQFQIGYKGMLQLGMRSGQIKNVNAGPVYEGEFKSRDKLTGIVDISGEMTGEKEIGYFCYLELINGFKKMEYWTKEEVIAHAKRFSQSFNNKSSAWSTDFTAMAVKTVIKSVFSKYAPMSIEFVTAYQADEWIDHEGNKYLLPDIRGNASELPPEPQPQENGQGQQQEQNQSPEPEDQDQPKGQKAPDQMEPGFGKS